MTLGFLVFIARLLPIRFCYFLSACGGYFFFLFSATRRSIVRSNMLRVLPTESDKGRQQQRVCEVFRNSAKNYFDLARMSSLHSDNVDRIVTIEGWQHLADAVNNETGTILASAHLGNFELVPQVLSLRGIKAASLVEPFDSTPFLRTAAQLRQSNGCTIIPVNSGGLRDGLKILRNGGTVVILCDRDIQGHGRKVPFFGEETSLPYGAVKLALHTGATILPVFCVRKSFERSVIYIEPPLRLVDAGNRHASAKVNLERLVAIMERYIRQYPEQWTVFEPVWDLPSGPVRRKEAWHLASQLSKSDIVARSATVKPMPARNDQHTALSY
jgi:lauroyl/myristoyl acyltransferase